MVGVDVRKEECEKGGEKEIEGNAELSAGESEKLSRPSLPERQCAGPGLEHLRVSCLRRASSTDRVGLA